MLAQSGPLLGIGSAILALVRGRHYRERVASIRAWLELNKIPLLREVEIFKDLSPAEMTWLKEATEMVAFAPGEVIYQPGTAPEREVLFILKWGRVRLFRRTPEGKKLEVAVMERGSFFGEMSILAQRMHETSAEAIEPSLVCIMSRADVERLILAKPKVGIRMVEALNRRLAVSYLREEALAFYTVQARLAAELVSRVDDSVVRATHQDLADMIGASRETVTKALDQLQREGLVDLSHARIRVTEPAALRLLASPGLDAA
jgi:CRP-like cAMP-binding protein